MEAYKPIDIVENIELSKPLIKLLCEAKEAYGEYKGYLKSLSFDYKYILESFFISDLYYSFKIDGIKYNKEDMFYFPYMEKNNTVIEFNNMKKCLLYSLTKICTDGLTIEDLNKLHKILLSNCKKDSLTKGCGHFRKKQTYILKPGIAGSSVSFVPSKYTDITPAMKNLCEYFNDTKEEFLTSIALTHLQFEKIHPYVTSNGKLGRLLIPVQFSLYKKEPPILYISESIDNLKNTYFTLLSSTNEEDNLKFIKFILDCTIDQCNKNIKKLKKLNKIYLNDIEAFKKVIGGTTIYKIYPLIIKNIVFTTNDIVKQSGLHINSVNKVLKKLVEAGYLHKEKRKGNNRVTFRYTNMYNILTM